jgi:hypothetical protein
LLNHQLWLRLTKCKPHEIALSKVIWVLGYAIFLGFLTSIWAIITALLNQVAYSELLWESITLFSYVIFAGGIITFSLTCINLVKPVINPLISTLISIFALISPIISVLIYSVVFLINHETEWLKFFPLFSPMLIMQSVADYENNLRFTILFGLAFLALSVMIPLFNERSQSEPL